MSSEGLVGIRELIPAGSNVSIASYGNDKGLIAEFTMEAVEVFFDGTNADGTPKPVTRKTYKDIPHVHIFAPGNKNDLIRPVKMVSDQWGPADPERFPRQWAAFQSQQDQATVGMPLEQWAQLSKAEVLEWKAAKVHTVEQLANIPDTLSGNFPLNFRTVRAKAKAWIEASSGDSGKVAAMVSEVEILKADNAMLKQQIAELAAQQTKRGPGRPRKDNGDENAE